MSMTVGVLGVSWDETTRSLGTQEWLGIDVGLRRYVARIMARLAPGSSPPPIEGLDVLAGATWGLTGTPPVLSPVNAEPLAVSEIRVGAGGASVAGDLLFTGAASDIGTSAAMRATGGRPRDVFVDRDLDVGRRISFGATQMQAFDGYSVTSVGTTFAVAQNARYDGTSWSRVEDDESTALVNIGSGISLHVADNTGPVAWPTMFSVDHAGTVYAAGSMVTAGDFQMPAPFPNSQVRISWYEPHQACYFDSGGSTAFRTGTAGVVSVDKNLSVGGITTTNPIHLVDSQTQIMRWNPGEVRIVTNLLVDGVGSFGSTVTAPTLTALGNIHIQNAGNGLYFEASHVVRTWWDGTWMRFSHPLHADSSIYTPGTIQCQSRLITNGYDAGWSNNLGGNVAVSGGHYSAGGYNAFHGGITTYAFYCPHVGNHMGQVFAWQFVSHSTGALPFRAIADDHVPMADALAIVRNPKLHTTRYEDTWPDTTVEGRALEPAGAMPSLGFDGPWQEVVPEVAVVSLVDQTIGLDYGRIGAITFEAVKQLAEQVEALAAEVAELKARQP